MIDNVSKPGRYIESTGTDPEILKWGFRGDPERSESSFQSISYSSLLKFGTKSTKFPIKEGSRVRSINPLDSAQNIFVILEVLWQLH